MNSVHLVTLHKATNTKVIRKNLHPKISLSQFLSLSFFLLLKRRHALSLSLHFLDPIAHNLTSFLLCLNFSTFVISFFFPLVKFMEENEKTNRGKLINPIPISMEISNSSHADPLFSSILTLYILILLYFPDHNTFSPLLLITLTLLLILLRFGATQKKERNCTNILTDEAAAADRHQTPTATVSTFCSSYPDQDHKWVTCKASNFPPGPCFEDSFVEWNVRAPLEVIYEGEEGKEAGEEENAKDHQGTAKDPYCIDRYSSLSLFYPETDSDSSSDGGDFLAFGAWGSPESACYRWEDDDREALIEIALDTNSSNNFNSNQGKETDSENFDGEEENNLIEIDISPTRDEERW